MSRCPTFSRGNDLEEGVISFAFPNHSRRPGNCSGSASLLAGFVSSSLSALWRWRPHTGREVSLRAGRGSVVGGGDSAHERRLERAWQSGVLSGVPRRYERARFSGTNTFTAIVKRWLASIAHSPVKWLVVAVVLLALAVVATFSRRSGPALRAGHRSSPVSDGIRADARRTLRASWNGFGCGGHLLPAVSVTG